MSSRALLASSLVLPQALPTRDERQMQMRLCRQVRGVAQLVGSAPMIEAANAPPPVGPLVQEPLDHMLRKKV